MVNLLKPPVQLRRGYKDKKRLEMVGSYFCLACQKVNRAQTTRTCVHHLWGQGGGKRASDLLTMPLCFSCHQGTGGLHDNLKEFEKKYYTQKQMINMVNEMIFRDFNLKGKDLERYYLIRDYCEEKLN